MKMSIGFDVSKETVDVALFDGSTMEHFQVSNSVSGFTVILKRCSSYKQDEQIITMEATGVYHQCAAEYFQTKGYMVSVVNPLVIKGYSQMIMMRAKTDKADAKIIAEYGFTGKAYLYKPKSEKSLKIQGFLKAINDLQQMRIQNRNRLEALSHHARPMAEVQNIYKELNNTIDSQIKQIEKEILVLVNQEYSNEYHHLLTIPGVGKRSASAMVGYFGEMEDFLSAKQLVSFMGMNPSLRESGTSVRGRGFISRKGNGYLRKIIYMAALSASKYNKSCKDLYDRLFAKGKSKKVALIAVANKLTRQIFAIVKYNRGYDPNFCGTN
jgi:transposase